MTTFNDPEAALGHLMLLAAQRRAISDEMAAIVILLRSGADQGHADATWEDIGEALGVTKQAAQQAYAVALHRHRRNARMRGQEPLPGMGA